MNHIVYKITNTITNKIYIGIHSTENLDDGYMGSSKPLKADIKRQGLENFKKEILFFCTSRKEAFKKEKQFVDRDFVKRLDTYNRCLGGVSTPTCPGHVNVKMPDGTCEAINKLDPRYISGELKHNCTGNIHSDETKKKIGEAGLGRVLSDDAKEKFRSFNKGKSFSVNHKKKISESNKGVARSKETCLKIGLAKKGRIWMYSDSEKISKQVEKCDVDKFLATGLWKPGRKKKTENKK